MKTKKIKSSRRGLTFSLEESDVAIGTRFRYVIDVRNRAVNIILDDAGGHTVSRKKSGKQLRPLFDLRSAEVKQLIADADFIELEITEEGIFAYPRKARKAVLRTFKCDKVSLEDVLGKRTGKVALPLLMVANMAAGMEHAVIPEITYSGKSAGHVFSREEKADLTEKTKRIYDVVSLFSGAGLFDKAWKDDARFRFVYGCDFCKEVMDTYRYNIGNHIVCKDVRHVSPEEIPEADVTIGGPCCQAYSSSNRHNIDSEEAEEKRLLIDDYARLVKSKVWVVENVPDILTRQQGFYFERLCSALSDYEITSAVVADNDVGGYSTRKRAIIIGSRIGRIELPEVKVVTQKTVRDALKKVDAAWFNYDDVTVPSKGTVKKMAYIPQGGNWRNIPKELSSYGKNTHSNIMYRLAWDEPSITLTNFRKSNILHPEENRILSVSEAAAIMGLDRDFRFFGGLSAKQQMVSNGVTQAVGRFVKNAVARALDSFYADSTLQYV